MTGKWILNGIISNYGKWMTGPDKYGYVNNNT